jgi:hypothetical protein
MQQQTSETDAATAWEPRGNRGGARGCSDPSAVARAIAGTTSRAIGASHAVPAAR